MPIAALLIALNVLVSADRTAAARIDANHRLDLAGESFGFACGVAPTRV